MQVLAIASGKGGTGKTTTAVTLAAIFAEGGARALVVDLDPQGSASAWLGMAAAADGLTVLDVLDGGANLENLARPSSWPGVDLVPSSPTLAAADRRLSGQPLAVLNLRAALARVGPRWTWVILDCGPGAGSLQTAAVAAAAGVLAPIEATALGLGGLPDLAALVETVGAHVTPAPVLVGILPCKVDPRLRLARAMLETMRERWGGLVMTSTIRASVKAAEAAALKQSLLRYDPTGPATADYRAAAVELQGRMEHGTQG